MEKKWTLKDVDGDEIITGTEEEIKDWLFENTDFILTLSNISDLEETK